MAVVWLVEDDGDIREIALYALQAAGFDATGFACGDAFYKELECTENPPHALILDIMLPGEDGLTILGKLRNQARWHMLPILMLTAKASEFDKVKGLDSGADDYLTKPYGVMELISRVKALLRRSAAAPRGELRFKEISLNPSTRLVTVNNITVPLTFKEYELLHYFLVNANIVLHRDKLLQAVWGYNFEGESRTLDMHVTSLRKKLGDAQYIKTVRNVGYTLGVV